MKDRQKALLCCICAYVSLAITTTSVFGRDTGGSYNLLLKAPLARDWFVISRSNLASRDHFDERFLGYTGAGLGYTFDPNWSLRVGYRHLWFRPRRDWLEERRPYAELYWQKNTTDWRITARPRLEWREFNYRESDRRLRIETVISKRKKFTSTGASLYFEHEIFYGFSQDQFEANWLGSGLAWRPQNGIKLKLGYRWNRFRVGQTWYHRDVLVTGFNIFF